MILVIGKAVILRMEWVDSILDKLALADNGIVVVTTHLYDGRKSLPLDITEFDGAYMSTK